MAVTQLETSTWRRVSVAVDTALDQLNAIFESRLEAVAGVRNRAAGGGERELRGLRLGVPALRRSPAAPYCSRART
jgi:hypothetical protein